MQPLSSYIGEPLKWEQPSAWHYNFVLKYGETTVAKLDFRSSFGSLATGESGDGCWTFKRVGFWQTRGSVRACDSETDLAIFHHNTWSSGGTLALADGRQLKATTNFWMSELVFLDEYENPLLRFKTDGFIHFSAVIEVEPMGAAWLREMPWLLMFGFWLAIMMHQDAAAAASVASAGGSS